MLCDCVTNFGMVGAIKGCLNFNQAVKIRTQARGQKVINQEAINIERDHRDWDVWASYTSVISQVHRKLMFTLWYLIIEQNRESKASQNVNWRENGCCGADVIIVTPLGWLMRSYMDFYWLECSYINSTTMLKAEMCVTHSMRETWVALTTVTSSTLCSHSSFFLIQQLFSSLSLLAHSPLSWQHT